LCLGDMLMTVLLALLAVLVLGDGSAGGDRRLELAAPAGRSAPRNKT